MFIFVRSLIRVYFWLVSLCSARHFLFRCVIAAKCRLRMCLRLPFQGSLIYVFFGTIKEVSIGPTSLMALLTLQYTVDKPPEFAIILAFLAGCVELAMGILKLGKHNHIYFTVRDKKILFIIFPSKNCFFDSNTMRSVTTTLGVLRSSSMRDVIASNVSISSFSKQYACENRRFVVLFIRFVEFCCAKCSNLPLLLLLCSFEYCATDNNCARLASCLIGCNCVRRRMDFPSNHMAKNIGRQFSTPNRRN